MSAIRKSLLLFAVVASATSSVFGQGIFLTGVGAVNRSMGGAATAAPIDAMGAIHWNPATISGLQCNEISFSAEVMLIEEELTASGITANSETGVVPIPAMAWVHHMEGTDNTIGLGLYSCAGFAQNLPAVTGHPILDSMSPFSPLYSDGQFFQIVPTFSRAVTERLSIGFAPTINLARVSIDPIPFGPAVFGPGAGTRWSWGLGAQAGIYYVRNETTRYGFSIKSPQWFEEFRTLTKSPALGGPAVSRVKLDLPMILSAGVSYTGFSDWTLAMDLRYFDYENTDGFGKPDMFGTELNWGNVFAVALGAQRRVNDKLYVRGGYTFNTSPINSGTIAANIATPLIQQHVIGLGASYSFAENVDLTMSYNQVLEADQSGPAFGGMSSQIAAYSIAAAVTVRYGS
ncbi:MAG: outer membrane protein transport protein [Planctomycetia bacterium]|nr:outer membrane protein transport protein [Planctomycetia bacterium]